MEIVFAYLTVPNRDEARRIGKTLVAERLAACINILPHMESWYWWEGEVEHTEEAVLIAKTTADRQAALLARAVELHPAACPCVVFLPVGGGHPAYLRWLEKETGHA